MSVSAGRLYRWVGGWQDGGSSTPYGVHAPSVHVVLSTKHDKALVITHSCRGACPGLENREALLCLLAYLRACFFLIARLRACLLALSALRASAY